jgi:hypothetical protein
MKEENQPNLESNSSDLNKICKSELFHIWKKARLLYDSVNESTVMEDWVRKNITKAYELIDQSLRYSEYEKIFPKNQEDNSEKDKENNFLSNEDKRYPVPVEAETGDQFITRCILDANMKKRYPVQGDRFSACMNIYQEKNQSQNNNPGEKFEDPMANKEPPLENPIKPILP